MEVAKLLIAWSAAFFCLGMLYGEWLAKRPG